MKRLSADSINEIRSWIYRNARLIELAIWQYEFENGSKETVLSALSHYQNDDGGFGNTLEPDSWDPNSSPYTTLNAIGKLKNIDFTDTNHPIMQGILKFLGSGKHCAENGWLFSVPSNNDYPHAPWWTYDLKADEYEHTGVTVGIVCFVLQFAEKESVLYNRAFIFANKLLSKFKETGNIDDMGLTEYSTLLEKINQLGLTDQFDIAYLSAAIKNHVDQAIVRDVSQWANYGVRPSQFILSPDSPFYTGNEEVVHKELDYLIETRPENGVWEITWHWYDNYEKYPKEFAISENWWKADLAISKLKFLRYFNRLD